MALLFSYGTLQLESVQIETFGRVLHGSSDFLYAYKVGEVEVKDEVVVRTSGERFHPILRYTANQNDKVKGMLFDVTEEELAHADAYEVDEYERIECVFESGRKAWVYVGVG